MNMKQMKETISKFRAADVSIIKDEKLRAKAQNLQAKQGGFTLLELLVVVAILAILAGSVISALSGQEEGAAQAVTVHTMATLEDGLGIYRATEKRTLPGNLDSLLCSTQVDVSGGIAATPAAADSSILGGISNVAKVGGGLTADQAGNLQIFDVTSGAMTSLVDAGLTSLRYVDADFCNTAEGDDATGLDTALVDVTKPNLIFSEFLDEGGEWEFGAGDAVSFAPYNGDTVALAILEEVEELTGNEEDVIAAFGIGPDSDLIGEIVRRAPIDGNGGPDKYSNYVVAVKFAECDGGDSIEDGNCPVADWTPVEPEIVAVLDAGGDSYYDEIAEAAGNEEE